MVKFFQVLAIIVIALVVVALFIVVIVFGVDLLTQYIPCMLLTYVTTGLLFAVIALWIVSLAIGEMKVHD